MNLFGRISTLILVCLVIVSSAAAQKKPAAFSTSGYYEGIKMSSRESGDSYGISIYLTQSANDTFALVTEAPGGTINSPVLVKAKMTGKDMRTIEFTLPGDNGDRQFKGIVAAASLTTKYFDKKIVLKRACGGTFSNISTGSGGDVGGMEFYITDSGGNWFVLAAEAEGELKDPVLVPAEVTGKNYDKISFSLGDRKFTGTRGTTVLTLNEGGTKTVFKQKCYK
ncbi:MAG TPA: hypothetical protein PLP21_02740 [Pyrinomonadaceae bacterium]|mgnify:FL=1|nr:hypothetical protein [Acidobacteriota bacterium]HQZ95203.1 hypothetical protein [Pyrinomonadaceae bacterium]